MFQTKIIDKIKTFYVHCLWSRRSYRLWDNVGKYYRERQATDDNIIWRVRDACWIPKVTDTHSESVILIDFLPLQWLHEHTSILRYTYIVCLIFIGPCIIVIAEEWKTNLMSLAILFYFLCTQHVSDINIAIIRSLRLCCWITKLVVLFLFRCVLEIWCGWFWVVPVLQAEAVLKPNRTKSPTQRNKYKTTNLVIQQHSRKLLMMDILMSETCWVHKK